jgi:hypothetical protein
MDIGYTYGGPHWERVSLYAPPGVAPPEELELTTESGSQILYVRLSDRSLACEKVIVGYDGKKPIFRGCGNEQCHRGPLLGVCNCGTHTETEARPQRAYEGEPAWEPPLPKEVQQRAQARSKR